jgi:hypothetical protein
LVLAQAVLQAIASYLCMVAAATGAWIKKCDLKNYPGEKK